MSVQIINCAFGKTKAAWKYGSHELALIIFLQDSQLIQSQRCMSFMLFWNTMNVIRTQKSSIMNIMRVRLQAQLWFTAPSLGLINHTVCKNTPQLPTTHPMYFFFPITCQHYFMMNNNHNWPWGVFKNSSELISNTNDLSPHLRHIFRQLSWWSWSEHYPRSDFLLLRNRIPLLYDRTELSACNKNWHSGVLLRR